MNPLQKCKGRGFFRGNKVCFDDNWSIDPSSIFPSHLTIGRCQWPLVIDGRGWMRRPDGAIAAIGRRAWRVRSPRVSPSKGATTLLSHEVINRSVGRPWAGSWAPLSLSGFCAGVLGSRLTHLCLIVIIRSSEWVISSALRREVASSGTRWLSCKPVVLVTLGGCHLLDGLVACDSIEAREKIVRCFRGGFVRMIVLTRGDIVKRNSSRACHWATFTFGVGSCSARHAGLASDAN
jgi:hypothetical protein